MFSFSPHHCVGFLFFAWHPPLIPHPAAPPHTSITPRHHTHHSTTHHITSSHQLITTQPLTLLLTSNSHHFITPTYHHTASHPNSHIQLLTAIRYHHTSHSHSSQHRASDHCTTQIIVHRLRLTYYCLEQVYIRYMISLFFPRLDFYMLVRL